MKKEFEKYVELHILTDNEKVVRVDMYHHENEVQEFDNLVKSYKTLGGARRGAKKIRTKDCRTWRAVLRVLNK